MTKDRNFFLFKGTILLSVSVIITKFLGVAFKVPLSYVLGDEGMGYFNTAYAIYGFFYILCTAGVPKSIMLVLSGHGIGEVKDGEARLILKCGLRLFATVGLIATLLNILCAPALASFVGNKRAMLSILAIAPSIFFVSLSGVLRGYLNNFERLGAIALSQLIEGVVKLVLGLTLALVGVRCSLPVHAISALGIFGISVGSFINFVYLYKTAFVVKGGVKTRQNTKISTALIRKTIVKNAFPIALSSSLLNLSSTLDLAMIMKRLVSGGMSEAEANSLYGNYTTLAVPMLMLVISVLSPLATSYMPRLSSLSFRSAQNEFADQLNKLVLITLVISVPATFTFYFYSFDVLDILFSVQSSAVGARMLVCLSLGVCLLSSLTVINTALESQGRIITTVTSLALGAITKFAASYILIGCPAIGVLGAPIGTVISYAVSLFVSSFALEISGVKVRVFLKLLLLGSIGLVSFYIPYKFIYSVSLFGNTVASLSLAVGISCVIYFAFSAAAYLMGEVSDMFKVHKKEL